MIALAGGQTTEEIASTRGVSRVTVRNQVRAVADKLGVHRQVEVAVVVNRMLHDR